MAGGTKGDLVDHGGGRLSSAVALAVTKALSRLASLNDHSKGRGQLSWGGRGGSPSSLVSVAGQKKDTRALSRLASLGDHSKSIGWLS